MQAFHLTDPNDFMRKLLTTDLFGSFRVSEATVTTFTTFHIDGTWQTASFSVSPKSWSRCDVTFASVGETSLTGSGDGYIDRYTY